MFWKFNKDTMTKGQKVSLAGVSNLVIFILFVFPLWQGSICNFLHWENLTTQFNVGYHYECRATICQDPGAQVMMRKASGPS